MYRPEVGEECLIKVSGLYDGFRQTKVLYIGERVAVYIRGGHEYTCLIDCTDFKPLKSEREETIERMIDSVPTDTAYSVASLCGVLYDAGLRFTEDQ